MERMHIPQKVIIPVSVMFRFFRPCGGTAGISDAMRMRKLGFRYFYEAGGNTGIPAGSAHDSSSEHQGKTVVIAEHRLEYLKKNLRIVLFI